jgi:hypothetical protein
MASAKIHCTPNSGTPRMLFWSALSLFIRDQKEAKEEKVLSTAAEMDFPQ